MARMRLYDLLSASEPFDPATTYLVIDNPAWCSARKISLRDFICILVFGEFSCAFSTDFDRIMCCG